jgi:tetratricopeptide (TPR) repeat protein
MYDYKNRIISERGFSGTKRSNVKKSDSQSFHEWEALCCKVVQFHLAGKYDEALPLAIEALKLIDANAEPYNECIPPTLNNLAEIYVATERPELAEPLFKRSLTILKKIRGIGHPAVAIALDNLAAVCRSLNKLSMAEIYHKDSFRIKDWNNGEKQHNETLATTLHNLATIYMEQDMFEDGEPLFLEALAIRQTLFKPSHPRIASTLYCLGLLYFYQNQYKKAERMLHRALDIMEQTPGLLNPRIDKIIEYLGLNYLAQEKLDEAEPLLIRSLCIKEENLGTEHSEVAITLGYIGQIYVSRKKYEKAEPLFLRALHIKEEIFGSEHFSVSVTLDYLADLYRYTDRPEQATECERKIERIRSVERSKKTKKENERKNL